MDKTNTRTEFIPSNQTQASHMNTAAEVPASSAATGSADMTALQAQIAALTETVQALQDRQDSLASQAVEQRNQLIEAFNQLIGDARAAGDAHSLAQEMQDDVRRLQGSLEDFTDALDSSSKEMKVFWKGTNFRLPAVASIAKFLLLLFCAVTCYAGYSLDAAASDGTTFTQQRVEQIYQQMAETYNARNPGAQKTYVEFRSEHDPKFREAYANAARKIAAGMEGISSRDAQELVDEMLKIQQGKQEAQTKGAVRNE